EREGEAGHHDGDEREAARDSAGERLLQNIHRVFPGRIGLREGRRSDDESQKHEWSCAKREKPETNDVRADFHAKPRRWSALRFAMQGKSATATRARLRGRNALVQRHARRTPNDLARCVLTPLGGRNRELRANFPLSSYSVFGGENVSRKNENSFAEQKRERF